MITLRRLDMVRKDSPATADELVSLQTQLNAFPFMQTKRPQLTVGPAGDAEAPPATPSGYIEILIGGTAYVLPFYEKA
jgi:hypothetical protein